MIKLLIFILGCLTSGLVFSGVYRCIGEDGEVEFRDKACEITSETEEFLPYVYEPTNPDLVLENQQILKKLPEKNNKKLAADQKKKTKQEARQKKAAEKAAAKLERRLMRCDKTKQKISLLEDERRQGCKLRRCNTIKKQLTHLETMQKKYCAPP